MPWDDIGTATVPRGTTLGAVSQDLVGTTASWVSARAATAWPAPAEVMLDDGGRLRYRWGMLGEHGPRLHTLVHRNDQFVYAFGRLGEKSDAEIVAFASTWGVLTPSRIDTDLFAWRTPEPLRRWRKMSDLVALCLRSIATIKAGQEPLSDEDRSLLAGRDLLADLEAFAKVEAELGDVTTRAQDDWMLVGQLIGRWLEQGGVTLEFAWTDADDERGGASLHLSPRSLLGALALELAAMTVGLRTPLICSRCAGTYGGKGRARRGGNLCASCVQARNTDSKRIARRRQRAEAEQQ